MVQRAMTRRQFVRGSAASLAGLSLAAATGSAGAAPVRGGTLTIGRSIDAGSLDLFQDSSAPASWVYGLIYEPLVTLSPSMQVQPGLASSWRVMSPTRARFMLRRGVKFHDGTPCDAAAIKFNFDRTFNPQKPGIWAAFAGPIKGAEIVDDYTVDVVTTEPFAPLLLNLSMVHGGMASPAAVRQYGADYGRHPVGTGPFKFVEWVPRDHITVARNDGYWGDKAPLDSIVFKVIPDDSARMIALRTGDADMVLNPLAEELPAPPARPGVHGRGRGRHADGVSLPHAYAAADGRRADPACADRGHQPGLDRAEHRAVRRGDRR